MSRVWNASMPSNIAIIKYMGKKDYERNKAMNPSSSMTLNSFTSKVEIEELAAGEKDSWESFSPSLPQSYGERFLSFFRLCKERENISSSFLLRSKNNFPSDCGLASSASSFAALSVAMEKCFSEIKERKSKDTLTLASLSQRASGSSCRSFFGPWCIWEGDNIYAPASNMRPLVDVLVLLSNLKKKVSSSEAHKKVIQSPLFLGREERVQHRMELFKKALWEDNFSLLAELSWKELWEMHSFFHTSSPPFFYFTPQTLELLYFVEKLWEKEGWGPVATVDAGPNVHLLIFVEEKERLLDRLRTHLPYAKNILESCSTI